jgi:hypothetical protein
MSDAVLSVRSLALDSKQLPAGLKSVLWFSLILMLQITSVTIKHKNRPTIQPIFDTNV